MWDMAARCVTNEGHRRRVGVSAMLIGCLVLTACETRPDTAQLAAGLDAPPPQTASAEPAQPAVPPEPIARPPARKPVRMARVAPRPAAPSTPPEVPMPRLVGLDEKQLTELLGTPSAERGPGPGKHLIYQLRHCAFDLSLYPSVDTKTFHLLSYEVNDDDQSDGSKQRCRTELADRVQARRQRASAD